MPQLSCVLLRRVLGMWDICQIGDYFYYLILQDKEIFI